MNEINYEELGTIELLKETEKGDLWALENLGRRYQLGDRIEQDSKKALETFEKVYKEANEDKLKYLVCAAIGEIYLSDEKLKNEELAKKFTKESFEHENGYGKLQYARYLLGEDFNTSRTEDELKEGAKLFINIFDENKDEEPEGVAEIASIISYLYLIGKGVEKDLQKSKEYAEFAANHSDNDTYKQTLNEINKEIENTRIQEQRGSISKGTLVLNENKLKLISSINFNGGNSFEDLMEFLYDGMFRNNIPCKASYIEVRFGNVFTGNCEPACQFYHPEHIDDYYYFVFTYRQQGNLGKLSVYMGGNSTQYSKNDFNERMKHSGGGLLSKTFSLAARGVNAIGKDKSKLQDEQLYYEAFAQNINTIFNVGQN